jgi:hypothetical protein
MMRRIIELDGKKYMAVKLAQSAGPNDKVLAINEAGENEIITVKHLDYIGAKQRKVTITVE